MGACSEAATVWPGSTLRDSTTPLMGERIEALRTLVSSERSDAPASVTEARALASSATARVSAASAVAISACDGTLPPLSSCTWRSRSRFARASVTVATACLTFASAETSELRERATWSSSLDRSSRASTWPCFTTSLSSTSTASTMPESSLPMSTLLVGCRLPVAETSTTRLPRVAASARYCTCALDELERQA